MLFKQCVVIAAFLIGIGIILLCVGCGTSVVTLHSSEVTKEPREPIIHEPSEKSLDKELIEERSHIVKKYAKPWLTTKS